MVNVIIGYNLYNYKYVYVFAILLSWVSRAKISGRMFMHSAVDIYFSCQQLFHNWFNKHQGVCCPVCGMVHIKDPLLLVSKTAPKR